MAAVHEHDSVGLEFAELADSEPGSGEHLDDQEITSTNANPMNFYNKLIV